ncbi:MAG: dienelactone hydrolase family protein [Beijerinckiaceae bacterium]|nr:dienelactone hydrolase family protein [Beijerinckiaceae bacterium]
MPRPLDGPRLKPKSGTTRSLVVFLHGYGADGNDLIDLGQSWADLLPDTAFVSPHAPEPCGMAPTGRQWWPLTMRDPSERWRGCQQAGPDLEAFLDQELARTGLSPDRLALVGFSQGAMMALHIGLRRAAMPGAIIGYSGHLVGPEHLKAEAKGKPPILLVHGDRDEIIPVDALFDAMDQLGKAEIPCQWHLSVGTAHGIDAGGLHHGGLFLAQNLR